MPAKSKAQQRFFGMVRAAQKGEMASPSSEVSKAATSMSKSDVKKFAKTKHKNIILVNTCLWVFFYKKDAFQRKVVTHRSKKQQILSCH